MLSSVIMGSKRNVNKWIATEISSRKNKLLDITREPTMYKLANVRVILKFSNSALVQKICSSL